MYILRSFKSWHWSGSQQKTISIIELNGVTLTLNEISCFKQNDFLHEFTRTTHKHTQCIFTHHQQTHWLITLTPPQWYGGGILPRRIKQTKCWQHLQFRQPTEKLFRGYLSANLISRNRRAPKRVKCEFWLGDEFERYICTTGVKN